MGSNVFVKGTYYFDINSPINAMDNGLHMISYDPKDSKLQYLKLARYMTHSERVWIQGSKGGVRKIKYTMSGFYKHGNYITNDKEQMKEFMWAKLQARTIA